jgi:hypothetical protein
MQTGPVVPVELDKAIAYYGRIIALRPDGLAAHANRRIAIVKYLPALEDERAAQTARLKRAGKDAAAAADAKERIAKAEATKAELEALASRTRSSRRRGRRRTSPGAGELARSVADHVAWAADRQPRRPATAVARPPPRP